MLNGIKQESFCTDAMRWRKMKKIRSCELIYNSITIFFNFLVVFNESYIFGEQTISLWCGHKSFGAQLVQSNGSQWDRIDVEKKIMVFARRYRNVKWQREWKKKNTRKQTEIKSHESSNKRIRSHKAEISLSKPNIEYISIYLFFIRLFCLPFLYVLYTLMCASPSQT